MALESVKELREKTGAGLLDCQKALGEAAGDVEKAIRLLRESGLAKAAKKATRAATDGAGAGAPALDVVEAEAR